MEHQLNDVQSAQLMKARDLTNEIGRRPLHFLSPYFLRLLWVHEQWSVSIPVQFDVNRNRHVQIQGSGPEAIVIQSRITFTARKTPQRYAFQSQLLAVFHLRHGVIDVGHGNDPEPDQPIGSDSAVFLSQPLVVSPEDRSVSLVIPNVAP